MFQALLQPVLRDLACLRAFFCKVSCCLPSGPTGSSRILLAIFVLGWYLAQGFAVSSHRLCHFTVPSCFSRDRSSQLVTRSLLLDQAILRRVECLERTASREGQACVEAWGTKSRS